MADIKKITEELEEGVKAIFASDRYREYLDCMGKFYNYSFNNTVLIFSQMPTASLVAGYNAWQNKFHRQVRKGERAIKILAPCPHKQIKSVEREDGSREEKEIRWTSYRAVNVFDVSQTEGAELPSIVSKLSGGVDTFPDTFNRLCGVSPVPVAYENIDHANGYFSTTENRIAIKAGMSEQQTLKTLVHEIAHAMLHGEDGEQKEAGRRTREVQAESVAYIVCSALGLDTADYSFGYIAGWSDGQEIKELSGSMDVIRKTAKTILEKLEGKDEAENGTAVA